jgi:hypothetical protein
MDHNPKLVKSPEKIYIMDGENLKGIVVNLRRDFVDDSSQVFAGNSPVGTGTLHLQVAPLAGKNL